MGSGTRLYFENAGVDHNEVMILPEEVDDIERRAKQSARSQDVRGNLYGRCAERSIFISSLLTRQCELNVNREE